MFTAGKQECVLALSVSVRARRSDVLGHMEYQQVVSDCVSLEEGVGSKRFAYESQ